MSLHPGPARVDDPKPLAVKVSAYAEYLRTSTLTSLQRPVTDDPAEMSFIVTTQVMELWFVLLLHEWRTARDALARDALDEAMESLCRSRSVHQSLNACFLPIAGMTPSQFNGFRSALGEASGFQSLRYHEVEFLLGEHAQEMVDYYGEDSEERAVLQAALRERPLYDEVLHFLHRRGLPVPEQVLHRDVSEPYCGHEGVEEVWRQVYSTSRSGPLVALGEVLTDLAELALRWRADHLFATRRAMGGKPGTGGTSGAEWLVRRMERPVFPELWTARTHV